jgi:hypothetical protein
MILNKGLRFTESGIDINFPESMNLEVEDFQRPLTDPISNLFLASSFEHVSIVLDYNYFIDDRFQDVNFQWRGGPTFVLPGRNTYTRCTVEIPEGKTAPRGLHGCSIERKKVVTYDPSALGLPLFWIVEGKGCVTKIDGGGLRVAPNENCPKVTLSTGETHEE